MPPFKNLIGQRFGSLTVLEVANEKNNGNYKWLCRCDCGELTYVNGGSLTSSNTTRCRKCGHKHTVKDLTGQRFGGLMVLEITNKKLGHNYKWLCRCDCGELTCVAGSSLTSGHTTCCFACRNKHISKAKMRFSFEEANVRHRMGIVRSDAKRFNRSFELTYDEYAELIFQDCFYCGAKPSNFTKTTRLGDPGIFYNGIDRVDNNKGYVNSNCVPCCWNCNQYKRNASIKWIINAAKKLKEGYEIDNKWCAVSEFEGSCIKIILYTYRGSSKKFNRKFNLTFEQVGALVTDNCFYCDKPASESERITKGKRVPYHGIDRVDNERGYEVDNVVPCCEECNSYYKRYMPFEWLFNVADKLQQFSETQFKRA